MLNKPCSAIVKKLKAYDPKLFVKWNNRDHVFEIWRRMPWGNRIITPVVTNIYDGLGGQDYCPLDHRIVEWIIKADYQRLPKKWKWLDKIFFNKHTQNKSVNAFKKFRNITADNYNILNQGLFNPLADDEDWLKPDVSSKSRQRISYRSGDNVKEFFNDLN